MIRKRGVTGLRTETAGTLAGAYDYCEAITRRHSSSFYFATAFLPKEKRRAIRALYAFCRWSDDLVDEPHLAPRSLDDWYRRARGAPYLPDDPLLLAWHDTRRRYRLPDNLIDELIDGVRMDLTVRRYPTFEALWQYCYRVASTVGLLSMIVIGHKAGADEYAIKLGVALQLTNILRDVGEDARRDRIYLPLEELDAFGLDQADILAMRYDGRYRALMRFQIERAHRLYDAAWPGIGLLHTDGRLAVAAATECYRAILDGIERNRYNNFTHRAFVPTSRKLLMLPRIWWKLRQQS